MTLETALQILGDRCNQAEMTGIERALLAVIDSLTKRIAELEALAEVA